MANPEDEALLDIQDQMGGVLVAPGIPSGLVQTPSALNRWMEEAIILDADSIHDCIAALKPEILVIVEKQRDEELSERRERRKKQQEEDATRRKKEEENEQKEREKNKDTTPSSTALSTSTTSSVVPPPITMEVAQPEAPVSVSETPSFGSFFHGFNMQSTTNNSAMSSTPLVRSNDHAETLATSIVEAVLGPALETVSSQARPQASENREPTEVTPTLGPSLRVQPQATISTSEPSAQSTVPVIVETPAINSSFITSHSLISTIQRIQAETTPNVDRGSDQSTTPFNPIPNATPGAPRVSVGLQEELHPFSTDQVQFIRRPLTFQGEITPIRPADESFTMGLSAEGNDVLIESFKVKYDFIS